MKKLTVFCVFERSDQTRCLRIFLSLSLEFPKSVQNREQLVEYLTVIIFTASAQHAAINFGQVASLCIKDNQKLISRIRYTKTLVINDFNRIWQCKIFTKCYNNFSMTGVHGSRTLPPLCGSPHLQRRVRWM